MAAATFELARIDAVATRRKVERMLRGLVGRDTAAAQLGGTCQPE